MKNYIKIFAFLFLILNFSCKTGKQIATVEKQEESDHQIVFLIFSIQNNNSVKTIKLNEKIISEGKLKILPNTNIQNNEGDLLCIFQDKKGIEISRFTIENPLLNTLEYFDENGNPHLKTENLKQNTFHLRAQLKTEMFAVKVLEYLPGNKTKQIAIIEL